ncbi:substrate-binding domain-containing protein [Ramlibacter rhizophilus]|uniref:LysR family transcriptional regulator n=1 Tax=Ramlibacter rhizophilus TaxID=1781167 RepID=A0A4Z0BDC4_9BURK|nr:substrate-binding domain-containing protein [Ramlibacter rhizophilus]TFY96389.1 LysR family transcriptional regulator [Ramlibacter rhizophilus]
MHKVELSYALASRPGGRNIRNPLIELLQAVRQQGSISGAARELGQSYRHVWGELRRWEAELQRGLVVWEKGQPARLTPFGEKLLWAERQAQARLAPQIEALHADLERAFAVVFDDTHQVLTLYASHDEGIAALREHAAGCGLHLDIRFTGSVDAIAALNEGRCTLAGFHTPPSPAAGTLAQRHYQPLLKPGLHKIIGFARRRQGLVVAAGNPLKIESLEQVARLGLRYVNRALGTGTRLLAEQMLLDAGLSPQAVTGWDRVEPSHTAVALSVASGNADAGLGIEAAAQGQGLGFVPLVSEDYFLVCLKSALDEPPMRLLRDILAAPAWQARLSTLPGYEAAGSGKVLSLSAQLPWWRFRQKRD